MSKQPSSYLSPKLEGRPKADGNGNGIFTLQPLKKGELVAVFGGLLTFLIVIAVYVSKWKTVSSWYRDRSAKGTMSIILVIRMQDFQARSDSLQYEIFTLVKKCVSTMPCVIPCHTMNSIANVVSPTAAEALVATTGRSRIFKNGM
jgi:hypothetical protein